MLRSQSFSFLVPGLLLLSGCAGLPFFQAEKSSYSIEAAQAVAGKPFSYDDYVTTLSTYVNANGMVNYEQLQQNRQALDRFNAFLAAVTPEVYEGWSKDEQLAYWINAYNSLTLQAIIDQDPLKKSIRDIPGVWNLRQFEIAQGKKTLDNIEHDTIRKKFSEPRIHAALVCAAMSCPPLRTEPYRADQLNAQLDDQSQKFIESPNGLKIDRQANKVYISKIFDWFGDDWKQAYGIEGKFAGSEKERAVLNFISGYVSPEDKTYLEQGNYQVGYLDYDWALNKQ